MNNRTDNHTKALWRKLICCLLAVLMLATALPMGSNEALAAGDGMIRVKLTKLGSGLSSITLKTSGSSACAGRSDSASSSARVRARIRFIM